MLAAEKPTLLEKLIVTEPEVAMICRRLVAPENVGIAPVTLNVMPGVLKLNDPPATIGEDAEFLNDKTEAFTSTFTVKLLANTSSALVGTLPVFQVAPALQFPFATAYTFAII